MSNNWFEFKIPLFNQKWGVDWDDFETLMATEVDNVMNKTYQLYWLFNPDYFTTRVAELVLNSLDLEYSSDDTLPVKKEKIRQFLTSTAYKGLGDLYLDMAEAVVGSRGTISTAVSAAGSSTWPSATGGSSGRWSQITTPPDSGSKRWAEPTTIYRIYINPDTTDNTELDLIQQIYREGVMYPAFYQIYLVDSSYTILRTI